MNRLLSDYYRSTALRRVISRDLLLQDRSTDADLSLLIWRNTPNPHSNQGVAAATYCTKALPDLGLAEIHLKAKWCADVLRWSEHCR